MKLGQSSPHIIVAFTICFLAMFLPRPATLQTTELVLETEPEPTVIELTESLVIKPDGSLYAIPVDPSACSGQGNGLCEECDCEDVQVSLSAFSANNQATSLTVERGQTVAFRWESRGAWSCEATGDFPNWNGNDKPPRETGSQQTVNTSSIEEGEYRAGLECFNGPVRSAERDVNILVQEGDVVDPADCPTSRQMSSPWNQASQCVFGSSADCTRLENVFGGDGSITSMSTGNIKNIVLNRNDNESQYIALRFNTNGLGATQEARFNVAYPQGVTFNSAPKMVTVSRCPGDFNLTELLDDGGCRFTTFGGLFQGGPIRIGGPASGRNCSLDLNETYYLNILFTDSPYSTDPDDIESRDCGSDGCGDQWEPQA